MLKKCSIFFMCWMFAGSVFADDAAGMFMMVKGDVSVTSGGATNPAKVGMKFLVGDVVKTGVDSRAKITMRDRNNIFVSPNSEFSLTTYESGAKRNVEMNLKEGKIRNEVNNKYDDKKNKFQIKTPTAVAGVRGTDFVTSFNTQTQMTEVVTMKGNVSLNSLTGGANVMVPAGQMSSVKANEPPAPSKAAPPEKMNEVKQDFSTANKQPAADKQVSSDADSGAKDRAPASSDGSSSVKDAGSSASGNGNANSNGGASNTNTLPASAGGGERMVDRQDQSPDTFDRLPNAGNAHTGGIDNTMPHLTPANGTGFNTGVGSTVVNGNPATAPLQGAPTPTKVIINPTPVKQ